MGLVVVFNELALLDRFSEGGDLAELADCLGVEFVHAFESFWAQCFLMICQEQAPEILMLEEVLAQILVLRLRQYLYPFGHLVSPRLGELHPHLQLLILDGVVQLVAVQLQIVSVTLDILEVRDSVLRTRFLQVVVGRLVEAHCLFLR